MPEVSTPWPRAGAYARRMLIADVDEVDPLLSGREWAPHWWNVSSVSAELIQHHQARNIGDRGMDSPVSVQLWQIEVRYFGRRRRSRLFWITDAMLYVRCPNQVVNQDWLTFHQIASHSTSYAARARYMDLTVKIPERVS